MKQRAKKPVSSFLYNHPTLHRWALLVLPVGWMALVYVVALIALLITALWSVNEYTGAVEMTWTFDNLIQAFTDSLYLTVTERTLFIAVLATVIDIVLAFPIAFYMARMASPRVRKLLVILVSTPLWAGYLVKAYAWRSVLSGSGVLDMIFAAIRRPLARIWFVRGDSCGGLSVASLRDHPNLHGVRAGSRILVGSVERLRCT
ncbi:ABC transporter permease [Bifidobacterium dentium]|uniref:Binding-protein-dependent transport systems inner membrane component n=1 Tax=Bifidobacterium dentium (strain ATCC 27534 / DSM 20436 / JCM 1195 / Bd1) TaxID=401473 RepID=D2Q7D2_BIFDB|nr:ABC transporter permease [Bifidobacterium dentium]ADB10694.1 Binding-protein-dependent transport systems inner membrane component [Bifidobacterium dentium Bd1]BAQ28000.1 putative truncated ABC transporter permease component [Bifidobacterium dentium JCM 1195 = DSM 20436]